MINNDYGIKRSLDMPIKEPDVTITLFGDKKEVFKHAGVIFSASGFIRFRTDKNKYICYSGHFKTEKQLENN